MAQMAHVDCELPGYAPGEGPMNAEVVFVGEAVGADEEREGRPFVGKAGKRLQVLIEKYLGLQRNGVYITNVVKHRPPGNRKPYKREVLAGEPWLKVELAALSPRVIVPMGDTAVKWFLPDAKVSQVHGKPHVREDGVIIVPWYHPAAGFRSPKVLRAIIEDAKDFWIRVKSAGNAVETKYELVDDLGAYEYAVSYMGQPLGFDVETTAWKVGKVNRFGPIVGYSLSAQPMSAVYAGEPPQAIASVLADARVRKVCHNAKFEYKRLREIGIEMRNFDDTMGAAYLLGYSELGLKALASKLLNVPTRAFTEVTKGVDLADREALSARLRDNWDYGCADADNTRRLGYTLAAEIKREGLERVYREIEIPLTPVLARMEERGIRLDVPKLEALLTRLERLAAIAEARANA